MEPKISLYQRLLAQDYDEASALLMEYLKEHRAENAYDDLLLPALSYAKADRRRGQLTERQEQFVFASVQALQEEIDIDAGNSPIAAEPQIHIVGCAAGGVADSLSLACLFHLVDRQRFDCEILSDAVLASETITWVAARAPAAVVIAVLPPGGLARSRYLCKRLRAAFAQLKILVLYWHHPSDQRHEAQSFLAAGADSVSSTVLEARAQIGNLAIVVAAPTSVKIGA